MIGLTEFGPEVLSLILGGAAGGLHLGENRLSPRRAVAGDIDYCTCSRLCGFK